MGPQWLYRQAPGPAWDHYICTLCGKTVRAHGNFGGGAIIHAQMHVRRGDAEEIDRWAGKHALIRRFIIVAKGA